MSDEQSHEATGPEGVTTEAPAGNVDSISGRDRDAGASEEIMSSLGPTQAEVNSAAAEADEDSPVGAEDEGESDADALDAQAPHGGL